MNKKIIQIIITIIILTKITQGIGVSPAKTIIDYSPNYEKTINLKIINNDKINIKAIIYVEGNEKKYIKPEKNILTLKKNENKKNLKVNIKLPTNLTEPGMHINKLTIINIPEEYFEKGAVITPTNIILPSGTVTATTGVTSKIIINVPYPGTYVKSKLHITNTDINEPIIFTISLYNFGKNPVKKAFARIRILGANNEEITEIRSNEISLKPQEEGKVTATWKGKHNPGAYYAEVYIQYDTETTETGKEFKIGRQTIKITNLNINSFKLGEIIKLEFTVINEWNKELKDVKGNVEITNKKYQEKITTIPKNLKPNTEEKIYAYWDTENTPPGKYDINLKLTSNGIISEKLFETILSLNKAKIKGIGEVTATNPENNLIKVIILLVTILIILNITLFIYVKKTKK